MVCSAARLAATKFASNVLAPVAEVRDRLFAGDVLRIDVVAEDELFLGLDRAEVILVQDSGAGAVDQHRARLHELEQPAVDHAAGFVVFRNMERHEVGVRENVFDAGQLDAELFGQRGGKHRIVAEHLHLEAGEPLYEKLPDMAEPEDADGFAGQFAAHELALLPVALARRDIGRDDMAAGGEHHGDDLFGHGVGIRARRVHHIDVMLARILRVDGVVTRAGADDQLQIRQQVDDLRRDFFAADDQHFGVGVGLDEIRERSRSVQHHIVAAIGQHGRCKFIQLGRNQYFTHNSISRVNDDPIQFA